MTDLERLGRRGRYVCPFCKRVELEERMMIAHRGVGVCAEKARRLRDRAS